VNFVFDQSEHLYTFGTKPIRTRIFLLLRIRGIFDNENDGRK
jgi:hypothetical protein